MEDEHNKDVKVLVYYLFSRLTGGVHPLDAWIRMKHLFSYLLLCCQHAIHQKMFICLIRVGVAD